MKYRTARMSFVIFIMFFSILMTGCSGSEGPADAGTSDSGYPPDKIEYELWPSTHQLDGKSISEVVSIGTDGTVTFSSSSTIASSLKAGHVLMFGVTPKTPNGLLRRVTKVEAGGAGIVVSTGQAALQHAFKKLHASFTRPLKVSNQELTWDVKPGATVRAPKSSSGTVTRAESGGGELGPFTVDFYPFNGDDDTSTPEDQVHILATLQGGAYYQYGMDFEWPSLSDVLSGDPLPEIVVGFAAHMDASTHLAMEGMATRSYEREDVLAHEYLTAFAIGPLVFTVTLDLISKVEGGATSKLLATDGASATFDVAAQYSSKSGGKYIPPTPAFNMEEPVVTTAESGYLRASIGPRLRLALYDVVGPYVAMKAKAEATADSEKDPCWDFRVGIDGDIGIDIELYGESLASWNHPFEIWDTSLASGACIPDPNKGKAPDLVDPTFTPWSERLEDTVISWELNESYTSLQQAVDGDWLVAGSGSNTLSKVTKEGTPVWSRRYTRKDATIPTAMRVDAAISTRDAGMFVTTYTPVELMKLDSFGDVVWALRPDIQYQASYGLTSLLEDAEGNIYAGGPYVSEDMGKSDAWIMKIDPDGNVLWSLRWGSADRTEWVTGLVPVGGDLIVIGRSFGLSQDPAGQSFAMRLTPAGSVAWIREISGCGGTDDLNLRTAILSTDGDIIAGGNYGLGGPRALLMKIKPDGSFGWANGNAGGGLGLDMTGFFQLTDGGYLMAGTWWTGGTDHIFVARSDSVGRMTWLKQFNDSEEDGSPAIALTKEGGALMAGYSGKGKDWHSMWLTRLPVKTGEIALNPAEAAVTSETFTVKEDPCVAFTPSTLVPQALPVTLVHDDIVVTEFSPPVRQVTP